ncbi:MAG: HD domain-containing protein [Actinomycetota bacterium]
MDQPRIVDLAGGVDPGGDLARRIDFLLEIDRLKTVLRRSRLVDGSRFENTAEHSWHLAMAAMVLAPYAEPDVDVVRAVEILLVHDIVEIDAGDTYIYDDTGDKAEREERAAERLFNLLPADQADHIDGLWREYEARATPTARFAYAIDRLQPLLLNAGSNGASWQQHGIRHSQAEAVNGAIVEGSTELWELASEILASCADEGSLVDDRTPVDAPPA